MKIKDVAATAKNVKTIRSAVTPMSRGLKIPNLRKKTIHMVKNEAKEVVVVQMDRESSRKLINRLIIRIVMVISNSYRII